MLDQYGAERFGRLICHNQKKMGLKWLMKDESVRSECRQNYACVLSHGGRTRPTSDSDGWGM